MANEIKWRHSESGATLYATIRSMAGTMWSTAGTPNFEALTVANWENYKIALTESPASSYFYVGTFPAVSGNMVAGWYDVDIFSGSVGISDLLVGTLNGYWDGTTFKFWGNDMLQMAGTGQTARDIGASVLLSVGTGTGQVNLSSGKVPATLAAADASGNLPAVVNDYASGKAPLQPTTAGRTLDVDTAHKAPVTLAVADISGGPVPAIFAYALDCPLGLVITGPAWAGTFDVAGVYGGKPGYKRRGQYNSDDYYVYATTDFDLSTVWQVGTALGSSPTGYVLDNYTPIGTFTKPDATISAPSIVSYNEGAGGNHVSPQHVHIAVYAYKTVDGETIYSAAAESDQYVTSETGVAVEWSWEAVEGAEGYVIHATIYAYDIYSQWDYWEDIGNVAYRTFTDAFSPAGNSAIDVSNTTVTYVNAVSAVIAIAAEANVTQVKGIDADTAITARVDASTAATNVGTILGKLAGITLLAKWLRGLFRKDTMDATAKSEVNDGGGAFDETTDSLQGIRDTEPLGTAMRGTDSAALAATALSNLVWTDAKAGYLNAAVDSRMATFSYTAPPDAATVAAAVAGDILATPANKLATNASGQVSASNLPTDQQTAIAAALTKALRWLRILGRKDAAPAAQLTEYNAADDSWEATGTFVNTTESVEAIAAKTVLITSGGLTITNLVSQDGTQITLYRGADHLASHNMHLEFTSDGYPDISTATSVVLNVWDIIDDTTTDNEVTITGVVQDAETVRFEPTAAETALLTLGGFTSHGFAVVATWADGKAPIQEGQCRVLPIEGD